MWLITWILRGDLISKNMYIRKRGEKYYKLFTVLPPTKK